MTGFSLVFKAVASTMSSQHKLKMGFRVFRDFDKYKRVVAATFKYDIEQIIQ